MGEFWGKIYLEREGTLLNTHDGGYTESAV